MADTKAEFTSHCLKGGMGTLLCQQFNLSKPKICIVAIS